MPHVEQGEPDCCGIQEYLLHMCLVDLQAWLQFALTVEQMLPVSGWSSASNFPVAKAWSCGVSGTISP